MLQRHYYAQQRRRGVQQRRYYVQRTSVVSCNPSAFQNSDMHQRQCLNNHLAYSNILWSNMLSDDPPTRRGLCH